MGLFSKPDTPSLDLGEVKRLIGTLDPTIGPSFDIAQNIFQDVAPEAFGAREGALRDIATPESTTAFFQGFQPTSLEQILGAQTFQNIFPDVQRSIKQNLSLSGIASSPILAQQIGRARGELGVSIGEILRRQAESRATGSLNARLGIDPFQTLNPLAFANLEQSNFRTTSLANVERAIEVQNFNEQVANFQRQQGFQQNLARLFGPIPGLVTGNVEAATAGSVQGLGDILGLFGGGAGGGQVADPTGALGGTNTFSSLLQQSGSQPVFGGGGGGGSVGIGGGGGVESVFNQNANPFQLSGATGGGLSSLLGF